MGLAKPDAVGAAPEPGQFPDPCSCDEWQHRDGACLGHDGEGAEAHAYPDACYREIEQDYADTAYRRMEEDHARQLLDEYRAQQAEEERYGMPLTDPFS